MCMSRVFNPKCINEIQICCSIGIECPKIHGFMCKLQAFHPQEVPKMLFDFSA
jgi:hypothetical protein